MCVCVHGAGYTFDLYTGTPTYCHAPGIVALLNQTFRLLSSFLSSVLMMGPPTFTLSSFLCQRERERERGGGGGVTFERAL